MTYRCPQCKSPSLEMTTIGAIVGPDTNTATCEACGWKGDAIDTIPCAVLEVQRAEDGRKMWDIPDSDDTPRRYFIIRTDDEDRDVADVLEAAQRKGMPRVGESGAERIDLERMFKGGWAAMVTYRPCPHCGGTGDEPLTEGGSDPHMTCSECFDAEKGYSTGRATATQRRRLPCVTA